MYVLFYFYCMEYLYLILTIAICSANNDQPFFIKKFLLVDLHIMPMHHIPLSLTFFTLYLVVEEQISLDTILHFIALIHPIQWTIANPVGADRPAKRQKKSPYMSA